MKKIRAFLVIMLLLLTGCGKNEPSAEAAEEYVYVPTFYEYETDYNWISCAVPMGEQLLINETWYFNCPFSRLKEIDCNTGTASEFSPEGLSDRYVVNISTTDRGYVVYSEDYIPDEQMAEYGLYELGASYLGFYDEDFMLEREINITDFVSDKSNFSQICQHMAVDETDNIYFSYQEVIYALDCEGKLLGEIMPDTKYLQDMICADGKVWVLYQDYGDKMILAPIDDQKLKLGESVMEIESEITDGKLFSGEKGKIYLATSDELYGYDLAAGEWHNELKWLDCDMDGLGIQHFLWVDGKFVCAEYTNMNYEITVLTKTPAALGKEKKTLTVTMLCKDYILLEKINTFNRKSQDIRLEAKYYAEEKYSISPDNLEKALQDFQLDLIAKDVGDIIFVCGEMDYGNLALKGAFADLNVFLEKDKELSKEDLMENVAESLSVNGILYGIIPEFTIETLVGKASNIGNREYWTVADMLQMLKEHEGSMLLDNQTKGSLLRIFLENNMGSFYDVTSGKCSFDGAEFQRLLKLANTYPKEFTENEEQMKNLHEGKILLEYTYLGNYIDLCSYRQVFGEEIHFIGYPTGGSSGNIINCGNGIYTISADSKLQDEAWQFVRQFLMEGYQKQIEYGFPMNKNAFEEMLRKEMTIEREGTYFFNGMKLEIPLMSETDAQYLREVVYGASAINSYDYVMLNMIMEEAESYFTGQKELEEVINIIQNRVQLYVDENK